MSEAMVRAIAELNRGGFARSVDRVLQHGHRASPDVLLVSTPAGRVVVKDFAGRPAWIRRGLGRWLLAREARTYRRLAGVPGVPRLLGRLDADALVLEYRPGVLLSRSLAGRLPPGFLPELETAVAAMHARGVVHLDLRHRSNVLAGDDGHPVLLDFASALRFDPGRPLGRLAVRLLAWIDRRALGKWRQRLGHSDAAGAGSGSSAGSRGASRPM